MEPDPEADPPSLKAILWFVALWVALIVLTLEIASH